MSRPRKLPVFLSEGEAARLLEAAHCPRDRCLFAVMLYAGLRVAEACALRLERIDLTAGQLLVYEGKGSRDRYVPIGLKLAVELRAWIGERATGYLFPGRKQGRPLTTRAARYAVEDSAHRAGIARPDPRQRISPHKLRHTFGSQLVAKGVDIATVRDLMGHADISTTSIYLHCSVDRLRGAVDRL